MRLIDADDVIQRITDMDIAQACTDLYLLGRVIGMIDNAATIDNVKRGKWKAFNEFDRLGKVKGYRIFCSLCNGSYFENYLDNNPYNYCPHCGAKMERGWNE